MARVEDTIRAEIVAIESKIAEMQQRRSGLQRALAVLESNRESGGRVEQAALPHLSAEAKKALALEILEVGEEAAKTPATVHAGFRNRGVFGVNVNNIRTILWRAARKGEIGSDRGRYWKHRPKEAGG